MKHETRMSTSALTVFSFGSNQVEILPCLLLTSTHTPTYPVINILFLANASLMYTLLYSPKYSRAINFVFFAKTDGQNAEHFIAK